MQGWFESCIIRSYANPIAEMQIMVSEDAEFKDQIHMAARFILFMKSDGKITKGLIARRPLTSSIWKGGMARICICGI